MENTGRTTIMKQIQEPGTKSRICKECGNLYIPSKTNKKGQPVDSNGNYIKVTCQECKDLGGRSG